MFFGLLCSCTVTESAPVDDGRVKVTYEEVTSCAALFIAMSEVSTELGDTESKKVFFSSGGILIAKAKQLNVEKSDKEVEQEIAMLLKGMLYLYSESPSEFSKLVGKYSGRCIELFVQVQENQ